MHKVPRERITLKSRIFGDEITFLAIRCGSYFLISRRQARRIPKNRGSCYVATDHRLGGEMPVIVDNEV